MTRNELHGLVKRAKSTAADKAMEAAARLGKPTSTGIAAGAGLGAILAAAGALSRHGEDPRDVSVLSNPLLLGTLGAAGGYLAGNAFENMPTRRANKNISTTALLAMLGGGGTLGNMLAKQDANDVLNGYINESGKRIGGARKKYEYLLDKAIAAKNAKGKGKNLKPLAREKEIFVGRAKNYSEALRRAGRYEEAAAAEAAAGVLKSNKSLVDRIIDKTINHPISPVSWVRGAFNTARRGTMLRALTRPKARVPAAIAGLALLAGGGKAIYDKVHD